MQKYGKNSWKPRFHELEHVSKMRVLKTRSDTSERRGYEADKKRQVKRGRKEAYPKGEKNVNENYRYVTWKEWGGWGERVSTEKRKAQVAPPPQQGGCEAKLYYRKGEKIT